MILKTMTSLRQLYTMTMVFSFTIINSNRLTLWPQDVHSRFRKEDGEDVVGRFNERFLLSLSVCPSCLVIDDELNILPISSFARYVLALPSSVFSPPTRTIKPIENRLVGDETPAQKELRELTLSLKDTHPVYELVSVAKTVDQV